MCLARNYNLQTPERLSRRRYHLRLPGRCKYRIQTFIRVILCDNPEVTINILAIRVCSLLQYTFALKSNRIITRFLIHERTPLRTSAGYKYMDPSTCADVHILSISKTQYRPWQVLFEPRHGKTCLRGFVCQPCEANGSGSRIGLIWREQFLKRVISIIILPPFESK